MKDPVRLISRSGLASDLLRAGTAERPTSTRVRRAVSALATAAAVGSVTGEAAGGAGALAAGSAGAALTKVGAGSVSVLLAVKWIGIGSLSALFAIGATEVGSRLIATPTAPTSRVERPSIAPPPFSPRGAGRGPGLEPAKAAINDEPRENIGESDSLVASPARAVASTSAEGARAAPRRPLEPSARISESSRSADSPRPRLDPVPVLSEDLAPPPVSATPLARTAISRSDVLPAEHGTSAPLEGAATAAQNKSAPTTLRLTKEVLLVDRAWNAVKRNDFTDALATLSDYERQFPELGLFPEVLFVRMEAEDRAGRTAAARLEASRILALYPKSAQAERARSLLSRH